MTAVAGTSRKNKLGTDPDLEKLARRWRRAGGTIEHCTSGHLIWTLGQVSHRTGRTMNARTVRNHRRDLERILNA